MGVGGGGAGVCVVGRGRPRDVCKIWGGGHVCGEQCEQQRRDGERLAASLWEPLSRQEIWGRPAPCWGRCPQTAPPWATSAAQLARAAPGDSEQWFGSRVRGSPGAGVGEWLEKARGEATPPRKAG